MILKIKGGLGETDWHIFTEITEIHYIQMLFSESSEESLDGSFLKELSPGATRGSEDLVILIDFKNKYGQERKERFDTVAYLCNDAGDTVEVIYAFNRPSVDQNP